MYEVCTFFVRNMGQCQNGDSCRFSHTLSVFSVLAAHPQPIKSMAVADIGGSPKILTGGTEPSIKVWNFMTGTVNLETQRATTGAIEHIEVSGQTIMWAAEEPLPVTPLDTPAGIVYMLDQATGSTLPVTRADVPFTHQQKVNCIAIIDSYVITAGTEGLIRAWQFAEGKFQQVAVLEGHIRSVTCLQYAAPYLWSGSFDATLRVWGLDTGKCEGCIGAGPGNANGHTAAIVCLEMIPSTSPDPDSYVASGGADGDVRLWKTNGEFLHACSHGTPVTALRCFQDSFGGQQTLLVGLMDGRIIMRSCATMNILLAIPNNILPSRVDSKTVWSLLSLGAGSSCFAAGGEDGQLVIWRVAAALVDTSIGQG